MVITHNAAGSPAVIELNATSKTGGGDASRSPPHSSSHCGDKKATKRSKSFVPGAPATSRLSRPTHASIDPIYPVATSWPALHRSRMKGSIILNFRIVRKSKVILPNDDSNSTS